MADYDQIIRALRNAHEAGDTASAQRLARMAQAARQGAVTREPQPSQDPRLDMPVGQMPPVRSAAPEANAPQSSAALPSDPDEGVAYDANGLPIPAPEDVPEWALSARAAAGEGVVPFAPGTSLPVSPEARNWLASAGREARGFLWGDNDPTTLNAGEAIGAALNKAGEAMTFGLVGDEAAGRVDELLGRGSYEERRDFYREQEEQLWDQRPGLAIAAEIGGGLVGPGGLAARVINGGVGSLARIGRAAGVGATTGGMYGAMDGVGGLDETVDDRTLGAALGAVTGGVGAAAITGIGQGFLRAAQALQGTPAAETVAGLKSTAQSLYDASDASGVVVPQSRLAQLATDTADAVRQEGYHPRLHPRLGVALDELQEVASGDQGLGRLELARRVAGVVARSIEPDERRLASLVIDHIDDVIEGLGDDSEPLRLAREIWGRARRLERVETIIEDASNAQGGFEAALASRFRTFIRNPRNLRGFNDVERQAMREIARGTNAVRALRGFADLFSPKSLQGWAATAGVGFGGAGPIAAALPVMASGAQAIADATVRGQARALPLMVGLDDASRATLDAFQRQPNALAALSQGATPIATTNYLRGGR
ncbi:hypothetical protein [Rubellimicrobium roseum]|uniref:Uncharacterized protein n=1 Tax=Rubellimicrobium roseum TaxID=687525 RepID=A0A5C4NJU1_9RHOB|nr:hypothetical protein [Rubellimicrobium roseum]TNC74155.1 hypothetical protein FHG71_02885 [Rubellimicrobium roseum]